jgi:hypothetical protein
MRKNYIIFLGLGLLFSGIAISFPLGPSPYERLRYNARFCKGDLKRVVYATLKSYTHRGCLEAGRSKLQNSKSKLYRKFDHPYLPDSQIIVTKDHRVETKEILIQAIDRRLGNPGTEKDKRLTQATKVGKKLLAEDVASFCALMGNYKLLADYKELSVDSKVDVTTRNASLILFLVKSIDIYALFGEYEDFIKSFEKMKGVKTPEKKEILSHIKRMRDPFLTLLDNLVVLKKRLSQERTNYTKDQLIAQRRAVKNALVGISGARHHQEAMEKAMKMLDPSYIAKDHNTRSEIGKKYPNFFYFVSLIRYTNLFNNQCLGV